MKKSMMIFAGLIVTVVAQAQQIARIEAWTVDLAKPPAKTANITRGESVWFQPTVKLDGPWVFPSNASVVMRYRSSDMTNTHYSATGSVYTATSGVLRVLWTPAQEASARAYSFEIEAATGTTAQIAISGVIFLRDSLASYSVVSNPVVRLNPDPWIAEHNTSTVAHADIRALSTNSTDALARAGILVNSNRIEAVADSVASGAEWYFTTNTASGHGEKTANFILLSRDSSAEAFSNVVNVVTSGQYIVGGICTNPQSLLSGPVTIECDMALVGGNPQSVIPVFAEIWYVYNGGTTQFGGWRNVEQTIDARSPARYKFLVTFPEPNITGAVCVVGYLRAGTVSGAEAGIAIFGGGEYAAFMRIKGTAAALIEEDPNATPIATNALAIAISAAGKASSIASNVFNTAYGLTISAGGPTNTMVVEGSVFMPGFLDVSLGQFSVNSDYGVNGQYFGGGPDGWVDVSGIPAAQGWEVGAHAPWVEGTPWRDEGYASGATNYLAWISSVDWTEVSGAFTNGSACLPLATPIYVVGEPWWTLYGASNDQQRARMVATARGGDLLSTQAVIRASFWAGKTNDQVAIWASWQPAQTNSLIATATNTVTVLTWTNAAGSGSLYADVQVTGDGTNGWTAIPKIEVLWK